MKTFQRVFLVMVILFGSCKSDVNRSGKKLTVLVDFAYHQKIYLQRVAFNEEVPLLLDSAVVQTGRDTLSFYIPDGNQQRLYTIAIAQSNIKMPVIADGQDIVLHFNYATKKYWFKNSPASQSLKNFNDTQLALAVHMRLLKKSIDSLVTMHKPVKKLQDSMTNLNTIFFERYQSFADTVKSPAAFLAVYDLVDFGTNTQALQQFINKAGTRFVTDTTLQKLRRSVLAYINAVENHLKIGDTIPELILPDANGATFSINSLKGKYVFINIWSTFCQQCAIYNEAARKAKHQYLNSKFEAVSIALDDQKFKWYQIVQKNNYDWPQLIDQKMWQGSAFYTLRFDSIPYNFLLSPEGRVLAKGISSDSVGVVISKYVQ